MQLAPVKERTVKTIRSRKTINAPIIMGIRRALVMFFCDPSRDWSEDKEEDDARSGFDLQFYRGNWKFPKYGKWLKGSFFGKYFPTSRQPGPPHKEQGHTDITTRPVEATVSVLPKASRMQIEVNFKAYFADGNVSKLERKQWQDYFDEIAQELEELLTLLPAS